MEPRQYAVIVEDKGIRLFAYFGKFNESVEAISPPSKRCIMTKSIAEKLVKDIKASKTFKLVGVKKLENTV